MEYQGLSTKVEGMMGEGLHKNSAGDSGDGTPDRERAAWRAPVITRFALERTLHTVGSTSDGATNRDTNT
jgi:hypothetical protein